MPTRATDHRYFYRLSLPRRSDAVVAIIMKNPSFPDVDSNASFQGAARWASERQFGEIVFLNLFARRSPIPLGLNGLAYEDAVGVENNWEIKEEIDGVDLVVAPWGQPSGIIRDVYDRRAAEVVELVGPDRLTRVGLRTSDGYPRHPLRWAPSMPLLDW